MLVVIAASCKKGPAEKAPEPTEQPPRTDKPAPPPAAPIFQSHAVQLMCGEKPLALPAPAAAAAKPDRPLSHLGEIKSCPDQASVAAACDCLVKGFKSWGKDLDFSAQVECEPQPPVGTDLQIVEVKSKAANDQTSGGEAFVVVAKHGSAWSPVAVIESAPDVDRSVTPQASHRATLDRVESHGDVYWIETHHEAQDKDAGDTDREGEAHGTVCVVGATPWCGEILLGAWTYAFAPFQGSGGECTITKISTYSAAVDEHSVNVRLEHGGDDGGVAGKYTF